MPNVSVIIPTYDRAHMIGDAIQSVLEQTYPDWELLVVDDGSHDHTKEVVAQVADARVRYLAQPHRGLSAARNTGVRNTRGHYVAFLDSDDVFLPGKLRAQASLLDAQPDVGLVGGGYFEVDAGWRVQRRIQPWDRHPTLACRDWLLACPFCPGVPLVRREWLERAGLFDETMERAEDWDLWLRMAGLGCRMEWLRAPVYCYRIHGSNMVHDVSLMKAGMIRMLDKLYAQADLPAEILALHDQAYANVYLDAAARAYAAGLGAQAKECLAKAVELAPSLMEGDPPQAFSSLASFAVSPLCDDADAFAETLVSSLPDDPRIPHWSRRKLRGLLHAVAAFEYFQQRQRRLVVKEGISALCADVTWARNRGLLAIVGRSLISGLGNFEDVAS